MRWPKFDKTDLYFGLAVFVWLLGALLAIRIWG